MRFLSLLDDLSPGARDGAKSTAEERRRHRRIPSLGPAKILSIGEDDEIRSTDVRLQDFSKGGYGVITEYKLPVGEMVWVQCEPENLHKAVVRYSKYVGELEWRTGLRILEKERRRAGRDRVVGAGFLSWINSAGARHNIPVTVTDISETGAGVSADSAIPVGVLATLHGESLVCSCLVRHCRRDKDRQRIGLMFTNRHKDRVRESDREWID